MVDDLLSLFSGLLSLIRMQLIMTYLEAFYLDYMLPVQVIKSY